MKGWSVRYRLLAIALLPMLVVLPLLLGGTIARWSAKVSTLLISKVNGDLTIAHQYLARILDNTRDQIRALGESAGLRDVISQQDGMSLLPAFLDESRTRLKLDFLFVIDPGGTILAAAPREIMPSARMDWSVIRNARNGASTSSIDIFQPGELAAISGLSRTRADTERGRHGPHHRNAREPAAFLFSAFRFLSSTAAALFPFFPGLLNPVRFCSIIYPTGTDHHQQDLWPV